MLRSLAFEVEPWGGGDSGSEKERGEDEHADAVVAAVEGYRFVLWYGVEGGTEKKDSGIGSGRGAEV